jgi:dipeptidyl aminopeptidase/acylaminoacyl peptidase
MAHGMIGAHHAQGGAFMPSRTHRLFAPAAASVCQLLLVLALSLLSAIPLRASAAEAPPSAEMFARWPLFSEVRLSPSGHRVAMIVPQANGRRVLAVLDLPAHGNPKGVAAFREGDVRWVRWVNDDRLVFGASARGPVIYDGEEGTYAVDHDGSNWRQLVAWVDSTEMTGTHLQNKMLPYGWQYLTSIDDGGDDVVVRHITYSAIGEVRAAQVARLNTRTGSLTGAYDNSPSGASEWIFDSKGQARVARSQRDGRDRLYLHQGDSGSWTLVDDRMLLDADSMDPVFLEAGSKLIVRTRAGHDTLGLYSYDLNKRALDPEPLVQAARFDVGPVELDRQAQHVVGARIEADRPVSAWFSDRVAAVQQAVDKALPADRFNTVDCGRCESTAFYVVFSQSDRQPGEYYLYDAGAHQLTLLGQTRPWIKEASQGRRSFHWTSARDGLPLPLVVTDPPGHEAPEALPAILMVHGGPWLREASRGWSEEAQFLASRGYRVIEPEFRGSAGFGLRHLQAGLKQWGRTMEDDLADAVHWAGDQGLIDPHRVCIYGGSYGGYAALMGPITQPGMFRCAASFAGVTDILLMFSSDRGDWGEQSRRYSLPALIGDPQQDADLLRQVSPVERVAEIRVPVLLVQGKLDRRVPREQADRFESAARKAGVAIERVDYPEEGHGWFHPEDHADFLNRLDRFFAKSLAP